MDRKIELTKELYDKLYQFVDITEKGPGSPEFALIAKWFIQEYGNHTLKLTGAVDLDETFDTFNGTMVRVIEAKTQTHH